MTLRELELRESFVALKDGSRVTLRPMVREDGERLTALFAAATDEDVGYLRDDVRDPAVVRGWCESLDYERVLPLTAIFEGRAVGQASLHFGCGPERHCGKLRVFVAPDFRRRGLATQMLRELIGLARARGLRLLMAEVISDRTRLIRACLRLGFELGYVSQDGFMLPDGSTRSVAILRKCLQPPCDDLGALTEE